MQGIKGASYDISGCNSYPQLYRHQLYAAAAYQYRPPGGCAKQAGVLEIFMNNLNVQNGIDGILSLEYTIGFLR